MFHHDYQKKRAPLAIPEKDIENDTDESYHQDELGASYSSEWRGTPMQRPEETFFSFLAQEHLQEAQDFRKHGHNSQIPEVEPTLLPQLRETVTTIKSRIDCYAKREDHQWLADQITQLKKFITRLSGSTLQNWVTNDIRIHRGEDGADKLGSRAAAQSLVRRIELTLQALLRVAKTLGAVVDYSTAENLQRVVVEELTTEASNSITSNDGQTVAQALKKMQEGTGDNAAWSVLVRGRVAAKEEDKAAFFETVITATRRAAEKANGNARELSGSAQAFFSEIAAYLLSFSGALSKSNGKVSKSSKEGISGPSSVPDTKPAGEKSDERGAFRSWVETTALQIPIIKELVVKQLHRGTNIISRNKAPEDVKVDSIIRSALWQWQQPAIKIQFVSGAILLKAKELKKIAGMLDDHANKHEAKAVGEFSSFIQDDADTYTQVREWVQARIEQDKPENKTSAKLAVLNQLFASDIATARKVIKRFSHNQDSMEGIKDTFQRQFSHALTKMINEQFYASNRYEHIGERVDKFLPDITEELAKSVMALNSVIVSAEQQPRNFFAIEKLAGESSLLASKVKEKISTESTSLTSKPLDDNSRGARLAKHWANLAKERGLNNWSKPDVGRVLTALRKHGLLKDTVSTGDPEGYLLATRLAEELENARNDELKLPMSPNEYAALEKNLIEFIVRWGQRRTSRGTARLVVELCFEQAIDTVTFSLSNVIRMPYKVLKASIMIPYKVNNTSNYIMPGQDKPYKAIYGLLGKKLSQLGFKLITTPVPGMIKSAMGVGITARATAYNRRVTSNDKTVSAVYERVAEGKQSRAIKMDSGTQMVVDAVLDTGFMAGIKGASKIWQRKPLIASGGDIPLEDGILHLNEQQLMPDDDSARMDGSKIRGKRAEVPGQENELAILRQIAKRKKLKAAASNQKMATGNQHGERSQVNTSSPRSDEEIKKEIQKTSNTLKLLNQPLFNPKRRIQERIAVMINQYNEGKPRQSRLTPDTPVRVTLTLSKKIEKEARGLAEKTAENVSPNYRVTFKLKDVMSGQYKYELDRITENKLSDYVIVIQEGKKITAQVVSFIGSVDRNALLSSLQDETDQYFNNQSNANGFSKIIEGVVKKRVLAYLDMHGDGNEFSQPLKDFYEGKIPSRDLKISGVRVPGVFSFKIGVGVGSKILVLNIYTDESFIFETKNYSVRVPGYAGASRVTSSPEIDDMVLPSAWDGFNNMVRRALPLYEQRKYTGIKNPFLYRNNDLAPYINRIEFSSGSYRGDISTLIMNDIRNKIKKDYDTHIYSNAEQMFDYGMLLTSKIIIPVSLGVGVASGSLSFLLALGIDTAYVAAKFTQAEMSDNPTESDEIKREALWESVFIGAGVVGEAANVALKNYRRLKPQIRKILKTMSEDSNTKPNTVPTSKVEALSSSGHKEKPTGPLPAATETLPSSESPMINIINDVTEYSIPTPNPQGQRYIYQLGETGGEKWELFEKYAKSSMTRHDIPAKNIFGELTTNRKSAIYNKPQPDSLSKLTMNDRLDVPVHGSSFGPSDAGSRSLNIPSKNYPAKALAKRLHHSGLREVGVLRIDSCNVGDGRYLDDLKRELDKLGIRFGYLCAPNGYLQAAHLPGTKKRLVWTWRFMEPWHVVKGNIDVNFPGSKYKNGSTPAA